MEDAGFQISISFVSVADDPDGAIFMQYCVGIILAAAFFLCCRAYIVRKRRKGFDKAYVQFPRQTTLRDEPFENPVCVFRGDGRGCFNGTGGTEK